MTSSIGANMVSALLSMTSFFVFLHTGCGTNSIHWVNTEGGSWRSASNWNPARVPQAEDKVVVNASGKYTITVDRPATIQTLLIFEAGVTLAVSNGLTVSGPCKIAGNVATFYSGSFIFEKYLKMGGNLSVYGGTIKTTGLPGKAYIGGVVSIRPTYSWAPPDIEGVHIIAMGGIDFEGGKSVALVLRNRAVLIIPPNANFVMATDGVIRGSDGLVIIDGKLTCRGLIERVSCRFECQ